MTKIKWGILGNAAIARNQMIPGLKQAKYSELYAIASRSGVPDDVAPEVKHYSSYEALLSDPEVQAVYIPVPNGVHKKWAIEAVKHGKHVLCEKPIAMNEAEAEEMFAAAEENHVLLMEAFMYRHTDKIAKAMEIVNSGAIGQVRGMHAHHGYTLNWASPARQDPALGGGAVYDVGCYDVSLIGLFLGEPDRLHAGFTMTETGYDERTAVWMHFPSGAMATMECWFDAAGDQRALIVGTEGTLEILNFPSGNKDVLILKNREGRKEIPVEACVPFALEADNLSKAVLGEAELLVTKEESLREMRVMDKIHALRAQEGK